MNAKIVEIANGEMEEIKEKKKDGQRCEWTVRKKQSAWRDELNVSGIAFGRCDHRKQMKLTQTCALHPLNSRIILEIEDITDQITGHKPR
jgi:hypothetical protein